MMSFFFFPFISYIFSFQKVSDQHCRILYVKYAYYFIKNNDVIFIKSGWPEDTNFTIVIKSYE